jgi:outer membrane protein assembly factor BamB
MKRYSGPGNNLDTARAVSVSRDGTKVFVTGESYTGSTTGDDYATVAYDAATGTRLWARRYNGPTNGNDFPVALASPGGNRVYVTGISGGNYGTVAYNATTGAQLWVRRYKARQASVATPPRWR